jgi:glycosyltransferase involved in cell wall biosynthesis
MKYIADISKNHRIDKFDFIHIHGDMYLKSALFLRKKLRIPLFYASRNNDIERDRIIRSHTKLTLKKKLFSLLYEQINLSRERQISHFADVITFQSIGDMGSFLERTGCDQSKIVIIPGNIGLPRFTQEWQNKNAVTKFRDLVYVGSLAPNKGLWEFLRVLAELKKRGFTKLRSHILTRTDGLEPLLNLIQELDIADMAIIEGYKMPFSYLADCSLMVYPVLYDAYPDTALEALHTGCPVLASAVGGLPDLLKYPELLFESGNVQEIADRVEKCITDGDFYAHIRALCAERADAHHFDWAERFENAMKNYLDKKLNQEPVSSQI